MTPAGFWRRGAAHIIDSHIIIVAFLAIILPLSIGRDEDTMVVLIVLFALLVVLPARIAYYVFFLSSKWQATPGKRLMGVYVVRAEDGGKLSHRHAFGRFAVYGGPALIIGLLAFTNPAPMGPESITPEELHQVTGIQKKQALNEPITPEENALVERNDRLQTKQFTLTLSTIEMLYTLISALMVAFTKNKTGVHDLLCKTRVVRGRLYPLKTV